MPEPDSECICGHYDRSHDDFRTRRCRVRVACDCSEWDATCDLRCDCPGYEPAEVDG